MGVLEWGVLCKKTGSHLLYVQEVANAESLSPIPNSPMASMTVGLL